MKALLLVLLSLCAINALTLPLKPIPIVNQHFKIRPNKAPTGALLGVRSTNTSMEIVTIDIPTGSMTTLDTDLNNKDGFLFEASSTSDGKGTYYVVLMSSQTTSQIFAVSAQTGKTLRQGSLPGTYYLLEYDTDLDCLFGVVEITKGSTNTNQLIKLDANTFKLTVVGTYPENSVPYIAQSAYDIKNKIMYNMMLTDNQYEFYYGMSVTNGTVVVKTPAPKQPTDPILFTLFCDQLKSRFISVSEQRTAPYTYAITEIDMKAGTASQVGTATFAGENFYPTVNGMSSDLRHYYAIMANTNTQTFDWYVVDIDTGAILYHVPNYTDNPPVDLTYVMSS